jgi:NDP-sugar pyrophosphorylase family protein
MIGQATSLTGKKYNIIILAGGAGSRMGMSSDYIPKALSKLGEKRAIDYIIERYVHIAHKFIIGTGYHADLLQSYVKGQYPTLPIKFSFEKPEELQNTAKSTTFCLDQADSRFGTIICFCDLLIITNPIIDDNTIYYVDKNTHGKVGIFRHSILIEKGNKVNSFIENTTPINITDNNNGVLGTFIFSNTVLLKSIVYSNFTTSTDLTWDIIVKYNNEIQMNASHCDCVYEFGDENNLQEVRKLWEQF